MGSSGEFQGGIIKYPASIGDDQKLQNQLAQQKVNDLSFAGALVLLSILSLSTNFVLLFFFFFYYRTLLLLHP